MFSRLTIVIAAPIKIKVCIPAGLYGSNHEHASLILQNIAGTTDKMAMPVQVTISSSTISRAVNLDWQSAKFTSFAVTGSSSGTFTYTVEGAIDDLEQTSAANVALFALSS